MRETDLTREFMRRFAANLLTTESNISAYILTEDEWEKESGKKFYKTYESFRASKTYFLKRNRMPRSSASC